MGRGAGEAEVEDAALPSDVFDMPELAEAGAVVSPAEARCFIDNGFLVKPGLIDPTSLGKAMDRVWAHFGERVPMADGAPVVDREQPDTWRSPKWGVRCRRRTHPGRSRGGSEWRIPAPP